MTTKFPSEPVLSDDIPGAYSESSAENNVKSREVYCPICHYSVITNLMGPRCKECNSYLITPLKRKTQNELVG